MKHVRLKAFVGLACVLLAMAALLFVPAWTLDYWQAWAFLAVYGISALAITLYLTKHDLKLLERRLRGGPFAEKEPSQRIIQTFTALCFIAMLVVSALGRRFGWSPIVPPISIAGDVLVALGLLIAFFVYRENSFASATIEIAPEQKVVSTGPYARLRHPLYLGGLVMFLGMSLALGSWWGMLAFALIIPAVLCRLLAEEAFLEENLPG